MGAGVQNDTEKYIIKVGKAEASYVMVKQTEIQGKFCQDERGRHVVMARETCSAFARTGRQEKAAHRCYFLGIARQTEQQ